MYPAKFDYIGAKTIQDAIAALATHGDEAKVLAGGHSLIPAMKLRLAQPAVLVDISRIAGLSGIREAGDRIAIGAMTTHAEIAASALLQRRCRLLPDTAAQIGDAQVRNKGTIGGSLVHADPAADWPAAVLALDAEIDLAGPEGTRTVRATEFFVDLLQTAIREGEILTEIRVPATLPTVAYVKTAQKASGFALAGVAVVVAKDGVRIGVTGVAPTAYRASAAEAALGKQPLSAASIAQAASHATDQIDALGDIHASPEFRLHMAQVNVGRALTLAAGRA